MIENECNVSASRMVDRDEFRGRTLLHKGKWANADVILVSEGGINWVVKDFSRKTAIVRWTIGRILTGRECAFLQLLKDSPGFPQHVERVHDCCLRYVALEGRDLGQVKPDNKSVTGDYFRQLERLLFVLHQKGIVHLDLRRAANLILCNDASPGIIDFQAALRLSRFPRWLQRILRSIDYSGIYKHWMKLRPETIDSLRTELFTTVSRRRRVWIFKGYPLRQLRKAAGRCLSGWGLTH